MELHVIDNCGDDGFGAVGSSTDGPTRGEAGFNEDLQVPWILSSTILLKNTASVARDHVCIVE